MSDAIIVVNAGSSSVKFSLFGINGTQLDLVTRGQLEGLHTQPRFKAKDSQGRLLGERSWEQPLGHDGALDYLVEFFHRELSGFRPLAVGHRVVHGGLKYPDPVRITPEVLAELDRFTPLFPLHQPHNLAPVRRLLERSPDLPQVACFDTSFHQTNPPISQLYALPLEYAEAGVRRYGFHGLSYDYIASVLPLYDSRAASGRTVVLHLGNGASMCALLAGQSQASSMGFTGVEGLPMGTRCGSLDPGVLLYLMDQQGMDVRAIERLLYKESGLLGVSGISSDMRTLLESPEPRARLAIDLYLYRIGRELGSLAAALGGLDAIVFTAGVGENAPAIRRRVCEQAAWLGVDLDPDANAAQGPRISSAASRVTVWVIPTNEELMIANQTLRILAEG